jgi:hypothetical protein|tara:strand:- start:234438 stop:235280 length:843 start_codon:yes stop_codon:yes gene_type:complete
MIKTPLRFPLKTLTLSLCILCGFAMVYMPRIALAQGNAAQFVYAYPYDDGELESQLGETPVVIELFSSQACMFCPVVDRFFSDLKKRTDLILLACHVDYFDVSKGAVSTPECSEQQRSYVRNIRGATMYTPQIFINGREDYVGYEFDRYIDEVIAHSKANKVQKLAVERVSGNSDDPAQGVRFEIDLMPITDDKDRRIKDLDIWSYMVEKNKDIVVAEGANKDKKLSYVNIVRKSQKIGRWDGTPQKVGFTVYPRAEHEGVTVLLKDDLGAIWGAVHITL